MSWRLTLSPETFAHEDHRHPWLLPVKWNNNPHHGSQRPIEYATFAIDCVTLVALFVFFACTCVISNKQGRLKGVLFALSSWAIWGLTNVMSGIYSVASIETNNYFNIDYMVGFFFNLAAECFVVFVLYSLIHGLLDRLIGRPYVATTKAHWVVLGFLVSFSLADWVLFITNSVFMINSRDTYLIEGFLKTDAARTCVFCAIAIEILVWSIYVAVKTSSRLCASKVSASLILAALSWFLFNAMYTALVIRYQILEATPTPGYQILVVSACRFAFCVALFVGIILCYVNWHTLENRSEGVLIGKGNDIPPPPPRDSYMSPQQNGAYKAYQPSTGESGPVSRFSEDQNAHA